jgi:signal transduction histidine kinase
MRSLGWTTQLRAGTVRPERAESAIASMDRGAQTLARLIEDLIESSRLQAGKVRLATDTIDLVAAVHDAVESVRFSAENKSVTLDVRTCASTDPRRRQPAQAGGLEYSRERHQVHARRRRRPHPNARG